MSQKKPENPLEAQVLDMADAYVALVNQIAEELAPFRPWWTADLSPDEQLWRYLEHRDTIVGWLTEAGAAMGWESWAATLAQLEDLFTSPVVKDRLPMELIVDERADVVRELVQASGPHAAALHIRKMERLIVNRAAAQAELDQARGGFDFPDIPPPMPIDPTLAPAFAGGATGEPAEVPPGTLPTG